MRRAKRHRSLAFEIKAGIVIAALLIAPFVLAPQFVGHWLSRASILFSVHPLPPARRTMMSLSIAPDGTLWALGKYSVERFPDSDPDQGEMLLNGRNYRKIFNHKQHALSTITAVSHDEAWGGSWYGEVFHFHHGDWREVTSRDEPMGARIHQVQPYNGLLYVSSAQGLWTLSPENGSSVNPVAFDQDQAGALLVSREQQLLYANVTGLYQLSDHSGEPFWTRFWHGASGRVKGLEQARNGNLILSTSEGLFTITPEGQTLHRHFAGEKIYAATDMPGGLLASVWGKGVGLDDYRTTRIGDFGLKGDSFSDLALTARGDLWLAGYGSGLRVVRLRTLRRAAGLDSFQTEDE